MLQSEQNKLKTVKSAAWSGAALFTDVASAVFSCPASTQSPTARLPPSGPPLSPCIRHVSARVQCTIGTPEDLPEAARHKCHAPWADDADPLPAWADPNLMVNPSVETTGTFLSVLMIVPAD